MGYIRNQVFKRSILIVVTIALIQITTLAPIVSAESNYINILDIDIDGYSNVVSPGQDATYDWTLENIDSYNRTLDVTISISNIDSEWRARLDPEGVITLPSEGDVKQVRLIVTAPNKNEGSTKVTLTFIVEHEGQTMQYEIRNTTTSLTAPVIEEKKVMDWFDNPLPDPLDNEWGIFLLTVLIWLAFSIILVFILDPFVKAFTKRTKTEVDDIILRIIRTPILVLVFFYGVVSSLIILEDHIPKSVIDAVNSLYGVVAVLILFYVAYKLFKDILVYYGEIIAEKTSSNIDNVIIPIVEKIGVVVIGLVALGYLLGYLNIDLTVFVAGGVVISMVIAFAAQETLSNFFSGIFILTDRPFIEGDTIILPDGDWYEVRNIGLRSTRLFRYKDASLISIPNNKLAGDKIINYSNPYDKVRIRKTIGVAYGTDVEKVKTILTEVFNENPHIITDDEKLKPDIRFDELSESSIDFFIQVIVDDRDNKLGVVDYLNTEIYKRFNEEGIEIPFPQRVVYVKKE
ncbi:MAG: mechanosensitive ion channel [Methanomassiliicoccales archaeon]|nr:MAG: mechanosensitive ion channel [Methanomassiliicoccales archaeon]